MGLIKGDIKKALGMSKVEVGGIELNLGLANAKDIVNFQEIPVLALSGKKQDELTADDMLAFNKSYRQYFVDFIMDKEPSANKEDVELFVIKNQAELQREFTIGFGLKSREQLEKDEQAARENQLKNL